MENNYQKSSYNKKSLWKWILLYVVIGAIAYFLIYYFFFAKNGGGSSYQSQQYQNNYPQTQTSSGSVIKSDQELMSASKSLDAADVSQIDSGLNQNTHDAQSFAPRIRYKDGTSTNWSGYAVETNLATPQSNAVSDVRGSWTVPAVTCTSANTYSSAWVGHRRLQRQYGGAARNRTGLYQWLAKLLCLV